MPDPRAWLAELSSIAPGADRTMLRVIARLLVGDASSDALLIVADALREAAAELRLEVRERQAAELTWIADLVAGEASARRPGRGPFW